MKIDYKLETVEIFAGVMKKKLIEKEPRPDWRSCHPGLLIKHLLEELNELVDSVNLYAGHGVGSRKEIAEEAADVANTAMIIADVVGNLREKVEG